MAQVFRPEKVNCMPDKKIFLARAGARYSMLVKEHGFMQRVNALFLQALSQIDPLVFHTTVSIDQLPNKVVPRVFDGAKSATVFLSTLGESIDQLINNYVNQGQTFEAMILDAWASESLETLNETFDHKLRETFGEGTMRFSPGYGEIDVRMNKYIVKELLNVEQITVLDSGEMVPRKTTTCMIGWYK